MGKVVITLKIYPEDPEKNLEEICKKAKEVIKNIGGEYLEHSEVPIAFGLKALEIKFVYPDQEFNEDELLQKINQIEDVNESEITNVTLSPF